MNHIIHQTAIIDDSAQLGKNVKIGPYSIIGKGVKIGDNCEIMHHVIIEQNTHVGKGCKFYPFCSIGTDPQDITYQGEETFATIGNNNVIREFVQINRGTLKGGSYTRIGNDNFIMAYSHIGHDCLIGDHVLLTNCVTLAGHVEIEDYVAISAFSSVHQFVRIGRNAYIGGYTIVLQDILPFSKVAQTRDSYDFYGLNTIGLRRCGMDRNSIAKIKEIFQIIYYRDLNTKQAVDTIKQTFANEAEAKVIRDFIGKSKRGLHKNFSFNARKIKNNI